MSKTGINFARCNCGSAQAHNERNAQYLEAIERSGKKTYDIFHDRTVTNQHWTAKAYGGKSLEQILQDCRGRYTAAIGQAPQENDRVRKVKDKKTGLYTEVTTAGWSPIREGVCPVKQDTVLQDFSPFVKHLAEKGLHVISIDIHRDEGYQDPATGNRKYNYHAHVIVDWTDHDTGKTLKLNKADMSEIQTVLADALHMERGEVKTEDGPDHLTTAQQREKAAAQHVAELATKATQLDAFIKGRKAEAARAQHSMEEAQQREATAIERAEVAEKAASREQLRSNLADAGARVVGLFGRGALAEAKKDREIRDAAEQEAEKARKLAEEAQKAQKQAEIEREAAVRARRTAESQKAAYGREMYENGVADGIKQGRQSTQASIEPLQQQLAAKQAQIDKIQREADELIEEDKKKFTEIFALNPHMRNWRANSKTMMEAGMNARDIQEVFMYGEKEDVDIPVTFQNKRYQFKAKVQLAEDRNERKMLVWFNGTNLKQFLSMCIKTLTEKLVPHPHGMHL